MKINEDNLNLLDQLLPSYLPFNVAMLKPEFGSSCVNANDLSRSDAGRIYYCPMCGAPSYLRINPDGTNNCFFSNEHRKNCRIGKRRTTLIKNGETFIRIKNNLTKIDSDPPEGGDTSGGEDYPIDITINPDDIDDNAKKRITADRIVNAGQVYDLYINDMGFLNTDLDLTVNELFLDKEMFMSLSNEGLAGIPLLIVTERCMPRTTVKSIDKSHVWLRIINSITDDKEVYIAVKLNNEKRNLKFYGKVTGRIKGVRKNNRNNIILYGKLRRVVGNSQRTTYELITCEDSVAFRNHKEGGYENE